MPEDNASGMPPLEEDFYRRLLARAAVAMLATDADMKVVCWNRAAGELFGMAPAEMLGKSIYDLVPKARHSLLRRLLDRTHRRGETTRLEVRLPDASGQMKDLVITLSPITGGAEGHRGVAAWMVDETRRVRLADRLAQAERMASLGTLAGGVAHHFNNILGGVATFVDYALTSGDTQAMRRALQMTAEAASRASRITQSLLSFARADLHGTDLSDLTEIVLTFAHLIERPLSEKKIQLELDLRPVPVVSVETYHLHQILGNLLANAEEAMPDGGTVFLRLDREGDEIVLTFADNGCGIEPGKISQVFEPFYTTKGLHAGGDRANPGLGLSVVHGMVSEMGARIDVESQVGKGTHFCIRFPITGDAKKG